MLVVQFMNDLCDEWLTRPNWTNKVTILIQKLVLTTRVIRFMSFYCGMIHLVDY